MICNVSVNPSRNPMFHKNEIEVGVGRSSKDFFIMFDIGFSFINCVFIKMMCLLFDLGGDRVLLLLVSLGLVGLLLL